jgi:hypothetical protein
MNDSIKSGIAFEESIMTILKLYCLDRNKKIYILDNVDSYRYFDLYERKNYYNYSHFDAYAPDGVFDDMPTIIEIKYSKKITSFKESLEKLYNVYRRNFSDINHMLRKSFVHDVGRIKFLYISLLDREDVKKIKSTNEIYKYDYLNIQILSIEEVIKLLQKYPIEASRLNDLISDEKNTKNILKEINTSTSELETTEEDIIYKKNKNIELLKEKLHNGELSIVLGTGVSIPFGALSWNKLVNYMYEAIDSGKFDNANNAFSKIGNDNLSKVQYIKLELLKNKIKYSKTLYNGLYNSYNNNYPYNNTSLYALANLINGRKIRKIITYNYDNYLEIILKNRKIEYSLMVSNENYYENFLPIYHVHGYLPYEVKDKEMIDGADTIVLSEDDYFKLYNNSNHWQVAIQLQSFKDDVCLFIGNSVTDYNEKRILNYTKQKFKCHFAIFVRDNLSIQDILKINNYYLEICNIEIIWADSIADISKIIKMLA